MTTIPLDPTILDAPHSTIKTFTGRYVNPWNLTPDDIDTADIAQGLAHCARWAGHSKNLYPVAAHSLWVAGWLDGRCQPAHIVLAGLLHDATEAYLHDITGPLKGQDGMLPYRLAEERGASAIARRYGIDWTLFTSDPVKEADRAALHWEAARRWTGIEGGFDGTRDYFVRVAVEFTRAVDRLTGLLR
jgi:uncharacterized protein